MKAALFSVPLGASILLLCGLLPACQPNKKDSNHDDRKPPPFDEAEFAEVTPMLDGSAYATDANSRLWYLRGNKAVRVKVVAGDASGKLPESFEVTPVLDGSAYLAGTTGGEGLWFLHGEHAERVSEVEALADSGELRKISDKVFYALYLSERKQRKEAEERADDRTEPSDSEDDYGPDY